MPIKISDKAYLTIISHLTKYPHIVSGLLLGTPNPPTVTWALPIGHSSLSLHTSPLVETALHLGSHKADLENMQIIGVYHGNDNANDVSISTVPTRLAEAVRRHYSDACLLMVHPPSLAPALRKQEHAFRVCIRKDATTWVRGALQKGELVVSESALKVADALMSGRLDVHAVADFEDHCLDPRQDWFNEGIEKVWKGMLASC